MHRDVTFALDTLTRINTSRNDPDWWRHNWPNLVHETNGGTFVELPWTPQDPPR